MKKPESIKKGDCIADILYKKAIIPAIKSKVSQPQVGIETTIQQTTMSLQTPHISTPHEKRTHTINIITFDVNNIHNVSDEADEDTIAQVHNIKTTVELPYQIYISSNSFEDAIEVSINTKGYYPSMGIILTTNTSMGHRPQLQECVKSTPAARILK